MAYKVFKKSNVRAIVKRGNKFLLVRRAEKVGHNEWQFVGGGIDGQKLKPALRRELKEETNLKVTSIGKRKVQKSDYGNTKLTTHYFDVKAKGRIKLQEDELNNHKWVTKEQAKRMKLTKGAREFINDRM